MTIGEILEKLIELAKSDDELRDRLTAAAMGGTPATDVARVSTDAGYPVSAMDIVEIGEEMYAHMKRSTNGGGANSPVLEGEDDFFAFFLAELREINE